MSSANWISPKACLVAIALASASSCADDAPVSEGVEDGSQQVYFYRYGDALHVFDVEHSTFFLTDADYLHRLDRNYDTDIAGADAVCSNEQYYCTEVGLFAVLPKGEMPQSGWSFNGIECTIIERLSSERTRIACEAGGRTHRFLYSTVRGIEYYEYVGEPGVRFELVGRRGLFAQVAE